MTTRFLGCYGELSSVSPVYVGGSLSPILFREILPGLLVFRMTNFVSLAGLCVIIRGWTGFPVPKFNRDIFNGPALAFLERRLL